MLNHLYGIEDPYGHDEDEAHMPGLQFLSWPSRYQYIEAAAGAIPPTRILRHQHFDPSLFEPVPLGALVQRILGYDGSNNFRRLKAEHRRDFEARYALTWRGLTRPSDRELGIAGGELIVLDMQTGEVLGVRRGYAQWAREGWGRLCPRYGYYGGEDKATSFTFWFVGKVVRPTGWQDYFAGMEKYRVKR